MKDKPYWYAMVFNTCPACGQSQSWKMKRVYDEPRPASKNARTKSTTDYCGCLDKDKP